MDNNGGCRFYKKTQLIRRLPNIANFKENVMKKNFSAKAKAASVIAGLLAAAGLGFLWGKKRNDKFEIEEFTIQPEEFEVIPKPADNKTDEETADCRDAGETADSKDAEETADNKDAEKEADEKDAVEVADNKTYEEEASEEIESATAESKENEEAAAAAAKININTAAVEELSAIHGIGNSKADNIVKYREEHGSFKNVDDLLKVYGIAQKKLDSIRELITV